MRLSAALLVVLAAVGLVACGGKKTASRPTGKAAYEQRLQAVLPRLQGHILKRRFALEASRIPARARILLRRTEKELRDGIARIAAASPPAEVASEHADLIAGYRAELADLRALEPLAHQRTTDRFRVAAGKLRTSAANAKVATALQAIIAKGYDLGF